MLAFDSKREFSEGLRLLGEERMEQAIRSFERCYRTDRDNPGYMSFYGLCVALRYGEIGLGLELCTGAIKREFYRPEFYANLGRVYMAAGNKKGAMNAFKKGLVFDPENHELNTLLEEIGVRNRPLIPFLRRANPINKFLGNLFRRRIPELFKRRGPRHNIRWNRGKAH